MTTAVIPRFLLPRGNLLLRSRPQSALVYPIAAWPASPPCRHASNKSPPSKPIVLEKPAKFNPPSHGARLKSKAPRQYPGPPLSIQQVEEQKTKQYPHMMPPEGSFMYWFLTNRSIHVCITLVWYKILLFFKKCPLLIDLGFARAPCSPSLFSPSSKTSNAPPHSPICSHQQIPSYHILSPSFLSI